MYLSTYLPSIPICTSTCTMLPIFTGVANRVTVNTIYYCIIPLPFLVYGPPPYFFALLQSNFVLSLYEMCDRGSDS